MARIVSPVSPEQLSALAGRLFGVLDFYYWRGIPCVRFWPYRYCVKPTPNMELAEAAFAEINRQRRDLAGPIVDGLKRLVGGSTYSWSDWYVGQSMRYWKKTGKIPPLVTAVRVEHGSGIATVEVDTSDPVRNFSAPVVDFSAVDEEKQYRGTTVRCRRPDPEYALAQREIHEAGGGEPVPGPWLDPVYMGAWGDSYGLLTDNPDHAAIDQAYEYWNAQGWTIPGGATMPYMHVQVTPVPWFPPPWVMISVEGVQTMFDVDASSWYAEHGEVNPWEIELQVRLYVDPSPFGDISVYPIDFVKPALTEWISLSVPFDPVFCDGPNGPHHWYFGVGPSQTSRQIRMYPTDEERHGWAFFDPMDFKVRGVTRGDPSGPRTYVWQFDPPADGPVIGGPVDDDDEDYPIWPIDED